MYPQLHTFLRDAYKIRSGDPNAILGSNLAGLSYSPVPVFYNFLGTYKYITNYPFAKVLITYQNENILK